MERYTKIDKNTVEVTVTTEKVSTVSLSQLKYDLKSLVKNKEENIQNTVNQNLKIDVLIAELEERIKRFEALGVEDIEDTPAVNEEVAS